MAVVGIGTDLVVIKRIEEVLGRHAERFVERVLHPNELLRFQDSQHQARYLAKRFAAKEAVSKALGTGIAEGVNLNDIEIANDERGKPHVILHGGAMLRMQAMAARHCHLSISDERDHALAFAVVETE
ncbi:holo-ACP synthase [Permianibacter sp. IMCC34836]|uniref:holo-ACP synthase n=1 Tax=Permianibacter fluminis TaxID=2738515 RepID=UPI001556FDC2|nr:holo-ACP synthase [Permianibacter fluminis]NQD37363.1 holo-ACP synthase [Permianibacter fluminis]